MGGTVRKSFLRFTVYLIIISIAFLLTGCEGTDSKDNNDNKVQPGVTLSGTISITSGTAIDNDVNDPEAPYTSNDSLEQAQTIPNPVSLGGYLNVPGTGQPGRSFENGDTDDYYVTQLFTNQSVTINIADFNSPQPSANSLALFLLDSSGNVIQHTTGQNQLSSVNVNSDGIYYLRVTAINGASNYVLTVGLTGTNTSLPGDGLLDNMNFVPGEVIVEFERNNNLLMSNTDVNTKLAKIGMTMRAGAPSRSMLISTGSTVQHNRALTALGIKAVKGNVNHLLNRKLETIEIVKKLRQRADIRSARLNYIRQANAEPNDEFFKYQWHYPLINLPAAWNVTTGSSDIIVAVIDTGVLLDHPDLAGKTVGGFDFIRSADNAGDGDGIDDNPYDVGDDANGNSSFHGTHVSGTIAASTDNTTGVAGIAWEARIMPLRVLGRFGGTDYDIEQAVRFAARLPNDSGTVPPVRASVINLSLGGRTNSTVPPEAFRLAREAGVIIVAAAGNEASNALNYPSSLDGVVSVSAVAIDKTLANYSNFGRTVDISAPGGEFTDFNGDGFVDGVLSTIGTEANNNIRFAYSFNQGTSMASPHVAGVVALMKAVYPEMTPGEFDQLLQEGAITDDLGATGRDNNFGYGLINAFKAVSAASALNDIPVEPLPPNAEVSPVSLNFGVLETSLEFNVNNSGGGDLSIIDVSNDSGGWLNVSSVSVNPDGLGSYSAQVNRDILPEENQTYSATITITSTANTVTIPVIMQVFIINVEDNAGLHYVILKDSESSEIIQKVKAQKAGKEYHFSISGVKNGTYNVMAGTDSDNDGQICEDSEACGVYFLPSYVIDIVVDEAVGNRGDINFETSFDNVINNQSKNVDSKLQLITSE